MARRVNILTTDSSVQFTSLLETIAKEQGEVTPKYKLNIEPNAGILKKQAKKVKYSIIPKK